MGFEFATAARIVFGRGKLKELPGMVKGLGSRALLVTGRNAERARSLAQALETEGVQSSIFPMPREPTVELVRAGAKRAHEVDFVIGFGGGSALDGAKAIAAVTTNSGEPLDYLEVVGRGKKLENKPKPFIAIPTTAGTGAEVTRNAVLESEEHGVKASLRDESMLARLALIDPDLTLEVPPEVTASTGLDTLTQLVEAFTSCRANALVDALCVEGMKCVAISFRTAYRDGTRAEARESMSFASLLSGLALANSGLGVVHGFAAPLGGMLHAPHGAICAALLPHGMAANIRALRRQAPDSEFLCRYMRVAEILTGKTDVSGEDGVQWAAELCRDLKVRRLNELGMTRDQMKEAAERAERSSSMRGNPLPLSMEELEEVLEQAY